MAQHLSSPTNTLFVVVFVFLMTTSLVDAFATTSRAFPNAAASSSSRLYARSSPLLQEALDSYPYSFGDKRSATTEQKATTAFNELARLYGDEEALAMVKLEPRALAFDSSNYAPCLDAWTEQFGLEKSQAMVGRNPGLLGVKPFTAKEPAEATMFFSYIIAATRPLPKILAAGLLLSIATAGFH